MFLFNLVLVGLLARLSLAADETLASGGEDADVVEATVAKIESACIFPDDKLFTRRLANVESLDGADLKTYRSAYYGGIWQVDKTMFDLTQDSAAISYLNMYIDNIGESFGIVWSQVKWENLTMPLYSALASRLYIYFMSRMDDDGIPTSIDDQAFFWVKYYRPGSNPNDFVSKSSTLKQSCISNGADIILIFDSSGSIETKNFDKMKALAKNVVNSFDVGSASSQNRFGLIQFADKASSEFYLNTYSTSSSVNSAIDGVKYMESSTATDLGLYEMRNNGFSEANGARPIPQNHPRIGIIFTDGVSNNFSATNSSAAAIKADGISLIVIGIGSIINAVELGAIASDQDCINVIQSSFNDLDSLHYIIEKRICDAPVIIKPGDNSTIALPSGGKQNCKINVAKEGVTIEIVALNEATTEFYVSRSAYPNDKFFDDKVVASPGHTGLVFIQNLENETIESIFCKIKAGGVVSNIRIGSVAGAVDACQSLPCLNGATCINSNDGSYTCNCEIGYTGMQCEFEVDACEIKPCINGGTCITRKYGDYTCRCESSYTGLRCEIAVDACQSLPCLNGATCINSNDGSYTCDCEIGYTGMQCEFVVTLNANYNCEDRNPCTSENIQGGQFYFPNDDPLKFVQCSDGGICYILSCPQGTYWDAIAYSCMYN